MTFEDVLHHEIKPKLQGWMQLVEQGCIKENATFDSDWTVLIDLCAKNMSSWSKTWKLGDFALLALILFCDSKHRFLVIHAFLFKQ